MEQFNYRVAAYYVYRNPFIHKNVKKAVDSHDNRGHKKNQFEHIVV